MDINFYFLGVKKHKQENLFKNLPVTDDSNSLVLLQKHFTISVQSHSTVREALTTFKHTLMIDFQKSWYEKFKNYKQSITVTSDALKQIKLSCKNTELDIEVAQYMNHDVTSDHLELCFAVVVVAPLKIESHFSVTENVLKTLEGTDHESN
jgi:RNase P/RNase MRP subunit p30